MSTRATIIYTEHWHIYHEMNDGWVYVTNDGTPEILIPICPKHRIGKRLLKWLERLNEWISDERETRRLMKGE